MSQECSRLQEEEAIRWMAVPHSVESTGQESGRGGRDEQGTEERSTRGKSIRRIKTTLEIFNIRAEEGREGEKESDRKCN